MALSLKGKVAAEIRAELARQAITQEELANRLGEGQPWVSKRLTGRITLDVADLERIAAALEVPVLRFLPESARVS